MFLGHFALGLAAKRAAPRLSLGVLFGAAQLADLLWPRPDMPLYPGSAKFGLGLWSSIPATMIVELAMYAAGVWIYLRTTRARDGAGCWGFILLAATLLLIYIGDALTADAPPSVNALIGVTIAGGVLFTLWSWWADGHRTPVTRP